MRYAIYDQCLESDIELPGLQTASEGRAVDVVFRVLSAGAGPVPVPAPQGRAHAFHGTDGTVMVELYELPHQYVLRFPDAADFWIEADGSRVDCHLLRDLPVGIIGHLLLGWVCTLTLPLRGLGVLHASAVAMGGRAIGFAGPPGRGKSTLVSAMGLAGWPVLTDEVLAIRESSTRPYALPGDPRIRLNAGVARELEESAGPLPIARDEAFAKVALVPDGIRLRAATEALPLGTIYLLEHLDGPDDPIDFRPLDPREAPGALLEHTFRIPRWHGELVRAQFRMLCDLAGSVPVVRIAYPRDVRRLLEVISAIREREASASSPAHAAPREQGLQPARAQLSPNNPEVALSLP